MPNILIVDDSWLTRRGVKRILLSNDEYQVLEAENGFQAMDILLSKDKPPVDAIILDLLMPEMSGVEFLEKLNSNSVKTPVIVLTADIQHTVKAKCIALGAAAFVNKPPEPDQLLTLVNNLFNNSSEKTGSYLS
ncbi:MAG: two-component system response regulator [Desulfamplus sp.]